MAKKRKISVPVSPSAYLEAATPAMTAAIVSTREAIEAFWQHLQFVKGWRRPPFPLGQVSGDVSTAAEIIVRIRTALDSLAPGFKLRMVAGSAHEYLFSLTALPTDRADFVRGLVHAAFLDGTGYVEGLDRERIDAYIAEIRAHLDGAAQAERASLETALAAELDGLHELCALAKAQPASRLASNVAETGDLVQVRLLVNSLRHASLLLLHGLGEAAPRHAPDALPGVQLDVSTPAGEAVKPDEDMTRSVQRFPQVREPLESAEPESATVASPEPASAASPEPASAASPEPASAASPEPASAASLEPAGAKPGASDASTPSAEPEPTAPAAQSAPESEPEAAASVDSTEGVLEIRRVAEQVDERVTLIHDLEALTQALRLSPEDDVDALHVELDTLHKLHKRALHYGEDLMRSLMALDAIVGLADKPTQRQARKDQVTRIQALLVDVDAVRRRIHENIEHVSQRLAALKAESVSAATASSTGSATSADGSDDDATPAPAAPTAAAPTAAAPAAAPAAPVPVPAAVDPRQALRDRLTEHWRTAIIHPKFEVSAAPGVSVISAALPGMRLSDLKITLKDGDARSASRILLIQGLRLPTAAEFDEMEAQFEAQKAHLFRRYGKPRTRAELDRYVEAVLQQLGNGVFGRFDQSYRVPATLQEEQIKASFRNGVLRLSVPRPDEDEDPRQRAAPWRRFNAMPGFGGGGFW